MRRAEAPIGRGEGARSRAGAGVEVHDRTTDGRAKGSGLAVRKEDGRTALLEGTVTRKASSSFTVTTGRRGRRVERSTGASEAPARKEVRPSASGIKAALTVRDGRTGVITGTADA